MRHPGSIGNLGNGEIVQMMNDVIKSFEFEKIDTAFVKLLNWGEKQ